MTDRQSQLRRMAGAAASSLLLVLGCAGAAVAAAPGEIPKPPGANPGGRGYEKVTPADKGGADVGGVLYQAKARAAAGGDGLLFSSSSVFAGAPSGAFPNFYEARRAGGGWSVTPALPASQSTLIPWGNAGPGQTATVVYVDDTLSTRIVSTPAPIAPGTISGVPSLHRHENGGYRLLTPGGPGFVPALVGAISLNPAVDVAPIFETATPDGEHVLFSSAWRFPDASELDTYDPNDFGRVNTSGEYLYMADGDEIRLVGVLPNGDPAVRAHPGSYSVSMHNAISDDGSRLYFMQDLLSSGARGPLYLNDNGVTVEIAPSDAMFYTATADGSRALYLEGSALYLYDAADGTSDFISGAGASVWNVLGVSDDLRYVYFSAKGNIIPGKSPTDGTGAIYLWHNGTLRHVANLANDLDDAQTGPGSVPYGALPNVNYWPSQPFVAWTPDGKNLVFDTSAQVTGYDAGGRRQVYRYNADSDSVSCISCSDGPATAGAFVIEKKEQIGTHARPLGPAGNITRDGDEIFFESGDALVPEDVNGRFDVYAWRDGELSLVSDGRLGFESRFVAASANGGDVFVATAAPLLSSDRDSLVDIYDARVGGGAPEPDAPVLGCVGDECQGSAGPRSTQRSAATGAFSGSGNPGERGGATRVSGKRLVTGVSASLRVWVPGRGQIRASGTGLKGTSKAAGRAGSYRVTVRLAARARRTLRREGRLSVAVTVRFTAADGQRQTRRLRLTFKQPEQAKRRSLRLAERTTRAKDGR